MIMKKHKAWLSSLSFLVIICFSACQEGSLDMADSFVYTSTYTALIDTVTIQLSTIVDTVKTSNTSNALIGYYENPILGGQEAKTYFSLSAPGSFTWDTEKEVFDSLVMVLHPNSYAIGDTTVDAYFKLHKLSETIELNDDGSLYNTNSFSYDATPISTHTFRPYPQAKEEIIMRLDDSFSKSIIDFLNTYKNHTDKYSLFEEEFKGFIVACDTNLSKVALGFEVSDSTSYLRLYSHTIGLEKVENQQTFSLQQTTHFNEIQTHNSDVIYNQLTDKKERLPEQQANGKAILQSGLGHKLRVDLPTINNLLELKAKGHVVKAELRIHPDLDIMETDELPSTLYIGDIYRANEIWGYLSDVNGNALTSNLVIDPIYNEDTYYSFDLTTYINSRLEESIIDADQGLFITIPESQIGSSLTWLCVNGHTITKNKSKLLLYYYYYDIE